MFSNVVLKDYQKLFNSSASNSCMKETEKSSVFYNDRRYNITRISDSFLCPEPY